MTSRAPGLAMAVAMAMAGCVSSSSVTCSDGRYCPAGTVCASTTVEGPLCVSQDQLDACRDQLEAAECGVSRRCYEGICLPSGCGNSRVDVAEGERCDDGNNSGGDGCAADCMSTESCGNSIIDVVGGEVCDDGDQISNDGCSSICRGEDPEWSLTTLVDATGNPVGVIGDEHAIAYDVARDRIVVFGDNTYEWDGYGWQQRVVLVQPLPRKGAAMAYDVRRKRMVLFGGRHPLTPTVSEIVGDTWEWDGSTWQAIDAPQSPLRRHRHAMAYDPVRAAVVMCGGDAAVQQLSATALSDCWTFDGTTWTPLLSATMPPARYEHAMAYDAVRGEMVMHGGGYGMTSIPTALADTWVLRSDGWHQVADAPHTTYEHAMAFDAKSGTILAIGGRWDGAVLGEMMRWDGQTWTTVTGGTFGAFYELGAITNGRGEVVRHGGMLSGVPRSELATWTGTSWAMPPLVAPPPRSAAGMAAMPLRGTILVFGGYGSMSPNTFLDDTWELAGQGWIQHAVTPRPGARVDTAMAYDAAHDRVILFGGQGPTAYADTWSWDGNAWTLLAPTTSPGVRWGHAMAYDAARERVVMFGGRTAATGNTNEMWTWDGTTWSQVPPQVPWPPAMQYAMMAYDPIHETLVMRDQNSPSTWLWDGTTWSIELSAQEPSVRDKAAMAWNPARRQMIMFGGFPRLAGVTELDDTWAFNGDEWHQVSTPTRPTAVRAAGLASTGTGVYLFGGYYATSTSLVVTSEAHQLEWQGEGAAENCSSGHDADGDGKIGCADPDCWYVCTPLCPPGTTCAATASRCGDGTCTAVEGCRSCPADCGACPIVCGDYICDASESVQTCPGDCAP